MHLAHRHRTAVTDLALGFALGAVLLGLNVVLTFNESLHRILVGYRGLRAVDWGIYGLGFWLSVMLALAFQRWRVAVQRAAELERIVSSISPDALLVLDEHQRITLCTLSMRRLLGYDPRKLIGASAERLYEHWRLGSDMPEAFATAYRREGFYMATATGRHQDGHPVPLEIIGMDLPEGQGRVLLLRDVTERQRMQERRKVLEARAEQWRRVQSLAHLACHLGRNFGAHLEMVATQASQALQAMPTSEAAATMVRTAALAAERGSAYCRHMLTYAGEGRHSEVPVGLDALVREAVLALNVPIDERVSLRSDLQSPPPIRGDPLQLRQCVTALLTNAVEAIGTHEGHITVRTGVRDCEEDFLRNSYVDDRLPAGRYAFIEVSDDGGGMDETTASRIFDPFFSTKGPGRGLELSYVLGVVRRHRGAITVRTAPNRGTTVTVYLPVETTTAAPS